MSDHRAALQALRHPRLAVVLELQLELKLELVLVSLFAAWLTKGHRNCNRRPWPSMFRWRDRPL